MLPTIQFDDQLFLGRTEINHQSPERMLAAETDPFELPTAQAAPQKPFGRGFIVAQLASTRDYKVASL